jgi:type I restriction enzyme R subunit
MFGTNYSTEGKSFYNYYRDVAERVRNREIDILLVVNMFLTGFDSPSLNTLYVDKNLRYHGRLQAYSRTNRILNERKSQGNIVAFRNLKKRTDEALELFANKDAEEKIFMKPYEEYLKRFDQAQIEMQKLVPTPGDVDGLMSEEQKLQFVKDFRELMRVRNILITFADFTFDDLDMKEQTFNDFKSKYLDIYDQVKGDTEKEKVSILDDVDFELELVRKDKINVDYILRLLAKMVDASGAEREKLTKNIMDKMSAEPELRSKRELIEKFINDNLPNIESSEDVERVFDEFWTEEKTKAFEQMCTKEGVSNEEMQKLIDNFLYYRRQPRREDLAKTLKEQPSILERDGIIKKLKDRFNNFIKTFIEGV